VKVLVVSPYPLFDRASGDLRFFQILGMMTAAGHQVDLCPVGQDWQVPHVGEAEIGRYRAALADHGVTPLPADVLRALRARSDYDLVIFEFFYYAMQWMDAARLYQPGARMLVDSVDVHYLRLQAKATLTGNPEDRASAEATKRKEIAVYRAADMVITVTEDDAKALRAEIPDLCVAVVPNIHPIHESLLIPREGPMRAIFVGSFRHEPNVDGIEFFCRDIWPLVRAALPDARLDIVGDAPPASIRTVDEAGIKVHGWVEETAPYLRAATVSVAPLRFGAGMKGKIGEAMSHGLPVITTTVGAEGMGFTHGREILIADSGLDFAKAMLDLHGAPDYRDELRRAGRSFISDRYGKSAVASVVQTMLERAIVLAPRQQRWAKQLLLKARYAYDQHLGWRFSA
jgi:glycosyltransferase involved in cell wall biosynthesis